MAKTPKKTAEPTRTLLVSVDPNMSDADIDTMAGKLADNLRGQILEWDAKKEQQKKS